MIPRRRHDDRGSASIWALLVTVGAFTLLLGLIVDGGRLIDARLSAARTAAQAARVATDSLSTAGVRSGHDTISTSAAISRAELYLHRAGMHGRVTVSGDRVTVTVSGRSENAILPVIGIRSFPIAETETAQGITEDSP